MIDISHMTEYEAIEFMKARFAGREAGRAVSRFGLEGAEADHSEQEYEQMLDEQ